MVSAIQEQMITEVREALEEMVAEGITQDIFLFVSDDPPQVIWDHVLLEDLVHGGILDLGAWEEIVHEAVEDAPLKLACVAAPVGDAYGKSGIGLLCMAPPLLFKTEMLVLPGGGWQEIPVYDALTALAVPLRQNVVLHG